MNWHRGLFRAWFVFTVAWAGIFSTLAVLFWRGDQRRAESTRIEDWINDRVVPTHAISTDVWLTLAVAVLVPLGLLVVSISLRWFFTGFRS